MKTFVISVKDIPARRKYIVEQAKLYGLDIELFDAINGKQLGLLPEQFNKLEFPNLDTKISYGGVGCALSHYLLWNLCKYLPDEEFLILEDDCVFCDGFIEKFKKLYENLPNDWEMVYVGWIRYGNDVEPTSISNGISIRIPSATHAYLIKKSALSSLIESLHPISSPIDLQIINKALPKLKYYVFDPSLVEQKSYMNFSELEWLSSGYNWEIDAYNVKRKIQRSFQFIDGWYKLERLSKDNVWIWSEKKFKLMIPFSENIILKLTSVIKNKINFKINSKEVLSVDLKEGDNEILINSKNEQSPTILEGVLENEFSPIKYNEKSTDTRTLGICLRGIEIQINGVISIPLDISKN